MLSHNKKGFFVRPYSGGQTIFVSNARDKVLALGNIDLECEEGSINRLEILRLVDADKKEIPEQKDKDQVVEYFRFIIPQLSEKVGHGHLTKILSWYGQLIQKDNAIELENEEDERLMTTD